MSVLENVAFGPRMLGIGDPIGTAQTFLSLVDLDEFEKPLAMRAFGRDARRHYARAGNLSAGSLDG
jgi:hypothetical protein